MANRLMQKLGEDYRTLSDQYDEILNRCDTEGRDPDDNEAGLLENLRSEMSPLGERLIELRETDERRFAAVRAMSEAPDVPGSDSLPMVRVGAEPEVYRPPGGAGAEPFGFFRDLLHAQMDGDTEAQARIARHGLQMRAAGTTTTGPGVVPPTWLFNEFAIIAHGARPWADTLRRVGIDSANPVNLGKQATPGATVTATTEGNPAPDGSFNANVITTNPVTYTGKVDVSRQLVDGSNPAIDGIVYADCMGAYNEAVENAVVAAFEALVVSTGFGALITYPGTPAYANLPDALIDASASVIKRRKAPPRVVFMSTGAWAFLTKQKDTQGRPLVTTGYHGPMNAYGLGEATQYGHIAGEVVGLQCIPSWAGVDNHVYVMKADDAILLESSTFNFRYEEVLGPSLIRLGVWGYAAPVLGRYPSGIVKIDAGTTIPAPAITEEEAAAEAAALEEGESAEEPAEPGSGPGTPRRRAR
jgi:HK97 family phage major capsid protein